MRLILAMPFQRCQPDVAFDLFERKTVLMELNGKLSQCECRSAKLRGKIGAGHDSAPIDFPKADSLRQSSGLNR